MKKNRSMRLATLLLALTLITSCFVGGTFAKYTTSGSADDTARVAKWGVEIITSADDSAFSSEYKSSTTDGSVVVKSFDDAFVVAPGTSSEEVEGTLVFGVTGAPEVKSNITVEFDGSDIYYGEYTPINFKLHILDTDSAIDTDDVQSLNWDEATVIEGTIEEIKGAIETNFGGNDGFTAEPNEVLDAMYKITWEWSYDDNGAGTNDDNDTALGDLMAAQAAAGQGTVGQGEDEIKYNTLLSYGVTITVTQID